VSRSARLAAAVLVCALAAIGPGHGQATPAPAAAPAPAAGGTPRPVDETVVHDVAAQLRCVVCQSLSVADSPSETALQMRAVIRERLAGGESPAQVRAYFVDKYGIWILLAPPATGFTLLVWVLPFAALALGLVLVAAVLWRWRRRARRGATAGASAAPLDPAMRDRIRREAADLDP